MIRWGIVGLGNMANHFANSIKKLDNTQLLGVASKSNLRLNKFNKDYNISKDFLFNDYNKLIESNAIDAIYISTLNNTHIGLIHKCIDNKKNILCEKPMGLNIDEVTSVFDRIKDNNILCYEAIAYCGHPQTLELLKLINKGEIGKIKRIEATFGFKVRKVNKKSRLFNKDLGGGAILDIGCYPISFFNLFNNHNDELKFINAKGSHATTGVDDYAEINLINKENIELFAKVSLKENLENKCTIFGSNGVAQLSSPWLPQKKSYIEITKDNSYYKKFTNTDKNIYTIQIENVSKVFNKIDISAHNLLIDINNSVRIMKTLDLWKKSINE